MHHQGRRQILIAGAACLAFTGAATGQAYPNKPIRLIIPFAQGGATDTIGRAYAPLLEKALGQPVIVVNQAGAGGAVGLSAAAKASPDGYTLAIGSDSAMGARPLMSNSGYTLDSFETIARVVLEPTTFVVRADSAITNLADLVKVMRAESLAWSSPGVGSGPHLGAETFFHREKVKARHVVANSAAQALVKLLSGEVQLISVVSSNMVGKSEDPKTPVRIVGVAADARDPTLPSAPTFREQGFDFVRPVWFGFVGPRGMPPEIVDRLSSVLERSQSDPAAQEVMKRFHLTPAYLDARAMRRQLESESGTLTEVLQAIGMARK